jgi:hypothetical protein
MDAYRVNRGLSLTRLTWDNLFVLCRTGCVSLKRAMSTVAVLLRWKRVLDLVQKAESAEAYSANRLKASNRTSEAG